MAERTNTATKPRTGGLRSVRDEQIVRKQSAMETVWAIARREAAGKSNATDGNILGGALAQAGCEDTDYSDMVAVVEKHAALAVDDEAAVVAMSRARRECRDKDEQIRKLTNELPPLQREVNKCEHALGEVHDRTVLRAEMEYEHALLLGLDAPPDDLDLYQLRGRNDSTLGDLDAKVLHVPHDVFQRGHQRRYAIMTEAYSRVNAMNNSAYTAWAEKGTTIMGQFVGTGKPPDKIKADWAWVCKTYDRQERDVMLRMAEAKVQYFR